MSTRRVMQEPPGRPAVVTVGDELVYGEREDGNRQWLLERLRALGQPAEVALSLPDDVGAIAHWITALTDRGCKPILVAGGLGGTHDDRTRQGVAAGLGLRLEVHPECDALLSASYGERYTAQRRRMAELPAGCALLPNPHGAPGFRVGDVFGFPGFPEMLRPMAETVFAELFPAGEARLVVIEVPLAVQEGDIALEVEAFCERHPGARVGLYPAAGSGPPGVVLRGRVPESDAATRDAFAALVEHLRRHERAPGGAG